MHPSGVQVGALAPFGLDGAGGGRAVPVDGAGAAAQAGARGAGVRDGALAQLRQQLAERFPASTAATTIMGIGAAPASGRGSSKGGGASRLVPGWPGSRPVPLGEAGALADDARSGTAVHPGGPLVASLRRDLEQRLRLAALTGGREEAEPGVGAGPESAHTPAARAGRRRSLFEASLGGRPWTAMSVATSGLPNLPRRRRSGAGSPEGKDGEAEAASSGEEDGDGGGADPPAVAGGVPSAGAARLAARRAEADQTRLLLRAAALLSETPLARQLAPLQQSSAAAAVLDGDTAALLAGASRAMQAPGGAQALSALASRGGALTLPGGAGVMDPSGSAAAVLSAVASLLAGGGSTARRPATSAAAAGVTVRLRLPDGSERVTGAGAAALFEAKADAASAAAPHGVSDALRDSLDRAGREAAAETAERLTPRGPGDAPAARPRTADSIPESAAARFARFGVRPGTRVTVRTEGSGNGPLGALTFDDVLAEEAARRGVAAPSDGGRPDSRASSRGQQAREEAALKLAMEADAEQARGRAAAWRRESSGSGGLGGSPEGKSGSEDGRPPSADGKGSPAGPPLRAGRRGSAFMALDGLRPSVVVAAGGPAKAEPSGGGPGGAAWVQGKTPAWWDTGVVDEEAEEEARGRAYTFAVLHPRCEAAPRCQGFEPLPGELGRCGSCGNLKRRHSPEAGFQALLVAMYERVVYAKHMGHLYERAPTDELHRSALMLQMLWRGYWARRAVYDTLLVEGVRKAWHPIARRPFYLRLRGVFAGLGSWLPPSLLRHQCVAGGRTDLPLSPLDRRREAESRRQRSEELRVQAAVSAAVDELLRRWAPRLDSVSAGESSQYSFVAAELCTQEKRRWATLRPADRWSGPVLTLYRQWDRNGDEELEKEEVAAMLDSHGVPASADEVVACMAALQSLRADLWRLLLPPQQRFHWRGFNLPRHRQPAERIDPSLPMPGTELPRSGWACCACCAPRPVTKPPPAQFTTEDDPMHHRLPVPTAVDVATFRAWLAPQPPLARRSAEAALLRALRDCDRARIASLRGGEVALRRASASGRSAWLDLCHALGGARFVSAEHFIATASFSRPEERDADRLRRVLRRTATAGAGDSGAGLSPSMLRSVAQGLEHVAGRAARRRAAERRAERRKAADDDTDSGWGSVEEEADQDPGKDLAVRPAEAARQARAAHSAAEAGEVLDSLAWRQNDFVARLLAAWAAVADRAATPAHRCVVRCEEVPRLLEELRLCLTASQLDAMALDLASRQQDAQRGMVTRTVRVEAAAAADAPVMSGVRTPARDPGPRRPGRVGNSSSRRIAAASGSHGSGAAVDASGSLRGPGSSGAAEGAGASGEGTMRPALLRDACRLRNRREVVLEEEAVAGEAEVRHAAAMAVHGRIAAQAAAGEDVEVPPAPAAPSADPQTPSNALCAWGRARHFDDEASEDAAELRRAWSGPVSLSAFYAWLTQSRLGRAAWKTAPLGELKARMLSKQSLRRAIEVRAERFGAQPRTRTGRTRARVIAARPLAAGASPRRSCGRACQP